MDLKERFENYESMPDEGVWQHVQKGLRRHKVMRYSAMAAILMALSAVAVMILRPAEIPAESVSPVVAKHVASEQQIAVQEEIVSSEETTSPQEQVLADVQTLSENKPVASMVTKECRPIVAVIAEVETTTQEQVQEVAPVIAAQEQAISPLTQEKTPIVALQPQGELAEHEEINDETPQAQPESKLQEIQQNYEAQVWVPNAFSPDDPSGGEVCTFKVVAKERANLKSFKMYIYNRAGMLVFQSTNIDEAWDGTYRGEKCPTGNYVYIIELNDEYAGLQHTRGSVLLIR